MSFLIKVKRWLTRGAFVLAGILGGVLGTALWSRWNEEQENEKEESHSAEDYENEQNRFEELEEISRRKREEIRSLPDADFDERYPSVSRHALDGGGRFVDRCRRYLQSRRSGPDSSGDHGNSPGGD
ncbi:hypothetical protein EXM22_01855 [Oceanispirochaeta crateris]|uniref:Uncharacterized protein n=1 Tax=Oceanispirochaeta crateris TaxID=2518645 RepID=A0A5C1QJM3_9SPIO|nr:hypothetical protein [Oceanispirochaeta crateris]QEN06794.1 hypothetical protein EXM22_01855 [Oceanispirochaeta crateris]